MMFIIIQQSTSILQKNNVQKRQVQSIQCGSKYLKETIGLSVTNNHLYQFLFIDNMIQIIRYDYQRLSENIDKNDYKLNLIDGEMLANGLEDLIPSDIVEQLMTVIHRTDNDDIKSKNNSNESPILSISMSINTNGKIRIYCIKSLNRMKYYIGDYNQEINSDKMQTFISKNDQQQIRGIISNQNEGILSLYYSKTSFCLNMVKLEENYSEWSKILAIDSSLNFIYEINEYLNEQQLQTLTKSFAQIFGPHTFTYGFVSDNNQIFLFSNQDEKLFSFSMDIFDNKEKYPFKLQSYRDFFHGYDNIDDKKQTTTMKTAVNESQNSMVNITNKSNDSITTTEPSLDEQYPSFLVIIIITIVSIVVFLSLSIGLFVYCKRKISDKNIQSKFMYFPSYRFRSTKPISPKKQQQQKIPLHFRKQKTPEQQRKKTPKEIVKKSPLHFNKKQNSPKKQCNLYGKLLQDSSITTATTMSKKSASPISTTLTEILSPDSSISKSTTTSSITLTSTKIMNVNDRSEILFN